MVIFVLELLVYFFSFLKKLKWFLNQNAHIWGGGHDTIKIVSDPYFTMFLDIL